jgi:hypothetical protein
MKNYQVAHKDVAFPDVIKKTTPKNQPNGKYEPEQDPSEARQYVLTPSVASDR